MFVIALKILVPFLVIFNILPLMVWAERKGCAYIQDRPGPNRASIKGIRLGGLIHSFTDVLKLLFKEDITPTFVHRGFFIAAPMISLVVACVTFIVIPFAAPVPVAGGFFHFQTAVVDAGILYILAMTSLGVYGVMLAGWSSNNKFALLGGLRSSAQMVSYELSMGVALLSVIMVSGSLGLNEIVENQGANVLNWNFLRLAPAAIIFTVAAFAETNRAPFDLPEGESELVAGYHVEYSSMKFAMFFMAEYANLIIASALIATLFFGGWQVPFVSTDILRMHAGAILQYSLAAVAIFSLCGGLALAARFKRGRFGDNRDFEVLVLGGAGVMTAILASVGAIASWNYPFDADVKNALGALFQFLTFLVKILMMCAVFIWVRWTLPRFRYDQLMRLGWKYMLPLALIHLMVVAAFMVVRG